MLRRVQTVFYGIEISANSTIGSGPVFIHPIGITIGPGAKIGNRVRLYGLNTIGTAKENGYPIICDDVTIGTGAKIIGPIHIGKSTTIGANAVVTKNTTPFSTVTGIPAKTRKILNEKINSDSCIDP